MNDQNMRRHEDGQGGCMSELLHIDIFEDRELDEMLARVRDKGTKRTKEATKKLFRDSRACCG
jgi:hypothetical protein